MDRVKMRNGWTLSFISDSQNKMKNGYLLFDVLMIRFPTAKQNCHVYPCQIYHCMWVSKTAELSCCLEHFSTPCKAVLVPRPHPPKFSRSDRTQDFYD